MKTTKATIKPRQTLEAMFPISIVNQIKVDGNEFASTLTGVEFRDLIERGLINVVGSRGDKLMYELTPVGLVLMEEYEREET